MNEYSESAVLDIFPNPSSGQFSIDFSKQLNQTLELKIYNTTGNCILNQSIEKWEESIDFNISDFPAGVYMVRLYDGEQSYSQKILKK